MGSRNLRRLLRRIRSYRLNFTDAFRIKEILPSIVVPFPQKERARGFCVLVLLAVLVEDTLSRRYIQATGTHDFQNGLFGAVRKLGSTAQSVGKIAAE
jgi:hypothetical protein